MCFGGKELALGLYVVISGNDSVVKSFSRQRLDGPDGPIDFPYAFSSVLFLSACFSVLAGGFAAFCLEGRNGLERCWDPPAFRDFAPVNALFQLAAMLKFVSLRYLAADVVQLLSQLSLVLVPLVARVILHRHYSCLEWMSLGMICWSMVVYLTSKGDLGQEASHNALYGIGVSFLMCLIESVATVFAEKYFKALRRNAACPFYIQKVGLGRGRYVSAIRARSIDRSSHGMFSRPWSAFGSPKIV